jgi:type IV pilus assembly protein PilO
MTGGFRKFVFFVLLIGVSYLAYRFMIKPANARLDEQKAKVATQMDKLHELEVATAAARDIESQMVQVREAVTFFESKLPPHSQIHKVLEQVTLIAQKQGLKTKSIRTLKQRNFMGYIEQPLAMELYGNFDSYYSFLLDLEQMPRITKIRELQLKKDTKNEGAATAEFVVSIFFQDAAS